MEFYSFANKRTLMHRTKYMKLKVYTKQESQSQKSVCCIISFRHFV